MCPGGLDESDVVESQLVFASDDVLEEDFDDAVGQPLVQHVHQAGPELLRDGVQAKNLEHNLVLLARRVETAGAVVLLPLDRGPVFKEKALQ